MNGNAALTPQAALNLGTDFKTEAPNFCAAFAGPIERSGSNRLANV